MAVAVLHLDQLKTSAAEAKRRIRDNWSDVMHSVAVAAEQSGRDADSVRVVGVTKYVDAAITGWLVEAGCRDLGENRPQTLVEKFETLADPGIRWHQIGHLQRNKVKRLMACDPMIHSIDSVRLMEEVDAQSRQQNRSAKLLIEVNIGDEDAKTGLPPGEVPGLIERWQSLQNGTENGSEIVGLMAMAPLGCDNDAARPHFAKLRVLRDELSAKFGFQMPELSMGMSGDYRSAIAEGATLVRIGSSLFAGVLLNE